MATLDIKYPFGKQTTPVKQHVYGKSGHQRYHCQSCKFNSFVKWMRCDHLSATKSANVGCSASRFYQHSMSS